MGYVASAQQGASGPQVGVCEVHQLVEGDATPRVVSWCGMCQAWICAACAASPLRRLRAAALRKARGG